MEVPCSGAPGEREVGDPLLRVIYEAMANGEALDRHWCMNQSSDPAQQWISFSCPSSLLPPQGWKLHVSANASSAETVLRHVLPILLTGATRFKVAASLWHLHTLNRGLGGSSQVGKFLTLYPEDDETAILLATRLEQATRGLTGPNIPSDRPLRPGSLVYYRYGSFSMDRLVQLPDGMIMPAICTPENELVPDRRLNYYKAPDWVIDPFVRSGIAEILPTTRRLIANRYLLITALAASPQHIVYLGTDLETARTCVLKGPGYNGQRGSSDQAYRERLYREAQILTRLASDPHIPVFYDLIEQEHDLFLVMEDIEGETLNRYVTGLTRQGRAISEQQGLAWIKEIAASLAAIHAQGLVYADMKSTNVLLTPNGQIHLIDLGSAVPLGERSYGTVGYMSPQQERNEPLTIYDDIYSLGALLYFIVTGVEPGVRSEQQPSLAQSLAWLRPNSSPFLASIITRCLAEQPEQRYSSATELQIALAAVEHAREPALISVPDKPVDTQGSADEKKNSYRILASKLLTTLCSVAEEPANHNGLFWRSAHPLIYGLATRDLYAGNAGTVLALAELISELADSHSPTTLARATQWLRSAPAIGPRELPGLYVGKAGVGAALLRAGQTLRADSLLTAAIECGRQILSLPYASPDLFNGTAGRLRFHLLLWDECGEKEQLQAAIICGKHLQEMASVSERQEVYWTIPAGYEKFSGQTYLGYAHGAAGIADALLDLFEVTGDEQLLPFIQGTGRWLMWQVLPALDDQSGVGWPTVEKEDSSAAFWCHGATGIGRFFLHLSEHRLFPGARDLALRAAQTVARGMRWLNPTQCHGLAGSIEFLLDVYQTTRDSAYLTEAYSLGQLLANFGTERHGHYVFPSEQPWVFTPDYMVGYAGIAMCLLRLSAPERLPHQLSRPGFRISNNATLQCTSRSAQS